MGEFSHSVHLRSISRWTSTLRFATSVASTDELPVDEGSSSTAFSRMSQRFSMGFQFVWWPIHASQWTTLSSTVNQNSDFYIWFSLIWLPITATEDFSLPHFFFKDNGFGFSFQFLIICWTVLNLIWILSVQSRCFLCLMLMLWWITSFPWQHNVSLHIAVYVMRSYSLHQLGLDNLMATIFWPGSACYKNQHQCQETSEDC